MSKQPLVSIITPLGKDHSTIERCIEMFKSQTYKNIEMIIVPDNISKKEREQNRVFADPYSGIRVMSMPEGSSQSIGAKLNVAIKSLASGEIILRMDADDIYSKFWIQKSVDALIKSEADLVGLSSAFFLNSIPEANISDLWEWNYMPGPGIQLKVCGATMCFWKDTWEKHKFADTSEGEDGMFCDAVKNVAENNARGRNDFTAVIHGNNTCSHKQLIYMRQLQAEEQAYHLTKRLGEGVSVGDMIRKGGYKI